MPLTRDVKKGSGKAAAPKTKAADKKPKAPKAPKVVPMVETQQDLEQDALLAAAAEVVVEPEVAAVVPPVAETKVSEPLPWENYTPPTEQPALVRNAEGKVSMASLLATGRVQTFTPQMDPNLAKLIKLAK